MTEIHNPPEDWNIDSDGDAIDAAEQLLDYETTVMGTERMEAYEECLGALAEAVAAGDVSEEAADQVLSTLCDRGSFKKKFLAKMYEEALDDAEDDPAGVVPLNLWLRQNVEKVIVTSSADSNVETTYTWVFEDGHTAETKAHHNDWSEFSNVLSDENVMWDFGQPEEQLEHKSDWKWNFMRPFLQEVAEQTQVNGARSNAVNKLRNFISSRTASLVASEAYTKTSIYMEDEDADYVYVLNEEIDSITDDHGITPRALQAELKSKGIIQGGVSERLQVDDGQLERFWQLPTDFAEPEMPEEDEDDEFAGSVTRRGEKA